MRYPSRFSSFALSTVLLASLAACAPMNQPSNNGAPVSSYPQTQPYPQNQPYPNTAPNYVEYGRVTAVETMQTPEGGRTSGVGAVLGGLAGIVVGNQIGGGSGRDAARVVGAVGGAVAGNAIEKSRNTTVRDSYRISIQVDNGTVRSYDVPSPGDLRVGDRVRMENNQIYRM